MIQIRRRYRTHLALVAANVAFAAVFVTIALSGFHQPAPHGLAVGVVAPRPESQRIESAVDAHAPGGFDLRGVSTEAAARRAIGRRRLDAALIATPGALRLLTAEAGGTAPTQAITAAVTAVATRTHTPVSVVDVVAPGPDDSQALSSFFVILCVLFPSLATGVGAGHLVKRAHPASRIGVLALAAAAVGLVAAGIADGIGGLGHYWAIAGIVTLFSLAVSAPTAALGQIRPHLAALAVLAFLILGIPASGGPANLAAFGPGALRSIDSALPLGVAADAVRNTVYFHAADTTGHLWVLAAYVAGGLAALGLLIASRGRRSGGRRADLSPATTTASPAGAAVSSADRACAAR